MFNLIKWIRSLFKHRRMLKKMRKSQDSDCEYLINLQGFIAASQMKFKETQND